MAKRSRLSKVRKKKEQRQAFFYLILAVLVVVALIFWGIPVFARFAGIILGEEGGGRKEEAQFVAPPIVYSLPEATASASLDVEGYSSSGAEIVLYLNNKEKDSLVSGNAGVFKFSGVDLEKGDNSIYAIAKVKEKESKKSKVQKVNVDKESPEIVIEEPVSGSEFSGEDNRTIEIKGRVNEEVDLKVGERVVILNPEGEFVFRHQLEEGENEIEFKAKDRAGNESSESVKYKFNL